MKLKGGIWKYGGDVNTDLVFPGKYTYTVTDPKEQAQRALEDLDPSFASQVQPGDIIVGGLIPMLRRKLGTEHLPMPEIKEGE
jgi:3-isopropylmalate/(R)-2-methylmalate dehydratase small subunit